MTQSEVKSINGREISDNYSRSQLLNKIDKSKINDEGTGKDELWSADKISSQIKDITSEKKAISKKKTIITIETDDGRLEDYTVLLPLLNAKGVNATAAIPPGHVGLTGYMSWEQIKKLVNTYNWSVESHTIDEIKLDTVSISEAERQMRESKKLIESQGIVCNHISYPNGGYNDDIMAIAKKYYLSGATITRGINFMPPKSHALYRTKLDNSLTLIKSDIDNAVKNNVWLIIYTHGVEVAQDTATQDKLNQVIDYALSQGAVFMNKDEAWNEIGNVIDIGLYGSTDTRNGFVLNKRGNFAFNSARDDELALWIIGDTDVSIDEPPTDYESARITVNQISNSSKINYPEGQPGILVTNNIYPWTGYIYQEYHLHNVNRVYRRMWTGNAWGAFTLVTNTEILATVANPDINKSADSYILPITYEQIDNNGKTNYPEGKPGMLVTNKIIPFAGYIYQDYHINSENKVYRRQWKNGVWTSFKILNSDSGIATIGEWTGTTIAFGDYGLEAQSDTNYAVLVTPSWNAGSIWVPDSDKKTTSFKVYWTTAPTSGKLAFKVIR